MYVWVVEREMEGQETGEKNVRDRENDNMGTKVQQIHVFKKAEKLSLNG